MRATYGSWELCFSGHEIVILPHSETREGKPDPLAVNALSIDAVPTASPPTHATTASVTACGRRLRRGSTLGTGSAMTGTRPVCGL